MIARTPSETATRFRNRLDTYHRRRVFAIMARRTLDRAPVHVGIWILWTLLAAWLVALVARS